MTTETTEVHVNEKRVDEINMGGDPPDPHGVGEMELVVRNGDENWRAAVNVSIEAEGPPDVVEVGEQIESVLGQVKLLDED